MRIALNAVQYSEFKSHICTFEKFSFQVLFVRSAGWWLIVSHQGCIPKHISQWPWSWPLMCACNCLKGRYFLWAITSHLSLEQLSLWCTFPTSMYFHPAMPEALHAPNVLTDGVYSRHVHGRLADASYFNLYKFTSYTYTYIKIFILNKQLCDQTESYFGNGTLRQAKPALWIIFKQALFANYQRRVSWWLCHTRHSMWMLSARAIFAVPARLSRHWRLILCPRLPWLQWMDVPF